MTPFADQEDPSRNHRGIRNGSGIPRKMSLEQRMCLVRHRLRCAVDHHQHTNNSCSDDRSRGVSNSNAPATRKPSPLQVLKGKNSHIEYRPCHVEALMCDNVLLSGDRRDQFGYQELTVGGTNCAEPFFASEYASLAEDNLQLYREFVEMKSCFDDDCQSALHATESTHDTGDSLQAISKSLIGAHIRFNNSASSSSPYHLDTTTGFDVHPMVESNVLRLGENCHIGPMASSWVSLDRCNTGSNRIRSQARDSTSRRNNARGGKGSSSSSSNPSGTSTVSKKNNVRKSLSASASGNGRNEKEKYASSARGLNEAEEKRKARLADYVELFGDDSDDDEDELRLDEESERVDDDDDDDDNGDVKLKREKREKSQQPNGKKQRERKRLKRVKDLQSSETKKRKSSPPSPPRQSKQRKGKDETKELLTQKQDDDDATPPAVKEKSRERLFQYLHSFMVDWGKTAEGLSIKKKLLGKMYSSMIKQETSSEQSSVASSPSVQSVTAEPISTASVVSDLSQTAGTTDELHPQPFEQRKYHQRPQHQIQNQNNHSGFVPIQHDAPLHPVHQLPIQQHIDGSCVIQSSHPFDPQSSHSQIGAPPSQHASLPLPPPYLDGKAPPALIPSARNTSDIVTTRPHAMKSADGLDSISHTTSSQESNSASPAPLQTSIKMDPLEPKPAWTGKDGISDKDTLVNGEVKDKPRRLRKLGASKSSTSGSLSGFMRIPKKKKVEKMDMVLESPSPASESSSHPEFQSPVSAASASGVPGWPSMPAEPTYAKLPFPRYQQQRQHRQQQQHQQQYPLHTAPPPFMHNQPLEYDLQVKHGLPQQQQQQEQQQQYSYPPPPLSRIMSSSDRISKERH